jgi:hypothetical protein
VALAFRKILTLVDRIPGLSSGEAESYRQAIELLSACTGNYDELAGLHQENVITRLIYDRIRVENFILEHPHLVSSKVERPLFIFGMPRTGTTFLSHLLGTDPQRRSLLLWEASDPVPPPTTSTLHSDPRCIALRKSQEKLLRSRGSTVITHFDYADEPTECGNILCHTLWDLGLCPVEPAELFVSEILNRNMTDVYRYHKKVLQILQSKAPGIWSLKYPNHGFHLPHLLTVYPDARLVWTHRDPYRVVASYCSHITKPRGQRSNLETIARKWLPVLHAYVQRPLEATADWAAGRIYHLQYREFLENPISEMRKLYAWLGDPFTPELEDRMRDWLPKNRQGKFGTHQYTLQEFGLTLDQVGPLFEQYIGRFQVQLEPFE